MRCTACGAELIVGKRFCHVCGTPVAVQCRGCGATIDPDFRFCPDCGLQQNAAVHDTAPPPATDAFTRLSRHIPTGLAHKIRATRTAIAGERKQVTVLFCDLVGSTAIAAGLDPEEYHDLLDRYLEIVCHKVYFFEGIVTHLAGDGLMALFGAPLAHEDAPQRGVRAALGIHEALARFSEREGVTLRARIGINTGPVVVGTVGNDLKMDYTAIGDTTNLAARLQSLAEPGSVLISETTYRLVRGFFEVRPLGPLAIKGKSELVPAYEVLRRSELATPMTVASERGLTPLVGRSAELAQLEECRLRLGNRAQVVSVVGDAGAGKSRLVYEFKRSVEGLPVAFLEGRCSSLGRTVPYFPFLGMFKHHFGLATGESPETVCAKVAAKIGVPVERVATSYPLLSRFISLPLGAKRDVPVDELKRESFDAVAGLVFSESHETPVVMTIEDLHWMDESSMELLRSLVVRLKSARVMVLVTERPDAQTTWPGQVALTRIVLPRLTDDDVTAIIRGVAGAPLPAELERRVVAKAEGSPFFAEEMTRGLFEEGHLLRDNGHCRVTRPVEEVPIPGSVQEVVAARLDRLPPPAKRAVQVAAVLGRQFRRDQLVHMLDGEEIEVDRALAELEERGLLHRKSVLAGDEHRFGESVTQEVAYEGLLLKQRRQLHERAGLLLEASPGEGSAEVRALIAHHFSRSDNRAKAVEALLQAADDAERLPAYRTAADFFHQAWDLAEQQLAAHPDEESCRRAVLAASLGFCRLTVLFGLPNLGDARRAGERARELAQAFGDHASLAALCYFRGVTTMMTERDGFARGLEQAEEGLAVAERAGDKVTAMRLSRGICVHYAFDGRFELARRAVDWVVAELEASEAHQQLPDLYVSARWVREAVFALADDLDAAARSAVETYEIAGRIPNRTVRSMTASALGQIHLMRGEYAEAKRWAEEGLEIAEAISNVGALPAAGAVAMLARLGLGETTAPERYLTAIDEGLAGSSSAGLNVRFIGDAFLSLGDVARATRYAELLRQRPFGGRLREVLVSTTLGDVAARLEHAEEAEGWYRRAMALAEAIAARSGLAIATLGAAELASVAGTRPPSAGQLERALAIFHTLRLEHYRPRLERVIAGAGAAVGAS